MEDLAKDFSVTIVLALMVGKSVLDLHFFLAETLVFLRKSKVAMATLA